MQRAIKQCDESTTINLKEIAISNMKEHQPTI
jgi:hypothetical protein